MKKIKFLIILLAILIFFSSCGTYKVACSVNNNTAKMMIEISIPRKDLSEAEDDNLYYTIKDLCIYWENSLGYDTVAKFEYDKQYSVVLSKEEKCDSKEDALYELLDMMSSSSSPFINVEGGYTESYLTDYYNIRAEVDLTKIVDHDFIENLPEKERKYILSNLDKFTGTVELSLDGKTIEYEGDLNGQTNTVGLSLDEPTEIYSLVEVVNPENQAEYQKLVDEAIELNETRSLYLTLVLSAAGLLIVLAAVVIFLILRRKSKTKTEDSNDTQVKEVEPAKKEVIDSDAKEPEVEDENSDKE